MKTRISQVFRVVAAVVSVARRPWLLDSGGPAGMTAFCRALCAGAARAGVAGVLLALSAAVLPQLAHAQAVDVAVLHSRVDNIDATLARMDGKFTNRLDRMDNRLDRMDERLVRLEEIVIRLDERVSGMQMQNQFIVIPLLLLTLTALIGLLTKGVYWGVERKPKESARRGAAAAPVAAPA